MKKGKFIVIYGNNNLGKSTQINLVHKKLLDNSIDVIKIKYPIYDLEPTGPIVNKILRNKVKISEEDAQKIFAQNRRDYESTLKELLNDGKWVLAEDYKGTGIAWGLTRDVPLRKLEGFNKNLLNEDLAILLDGNRFLTKIEKGHRNEDSNEWEKSREMHLKLAKRYKWKILKNAHKSVEDVSDRLWKIIKKEI